MRDSFLGTTVDSCVEKQYVLCKWGSMKNLVQTSCFIWVKSGKALTLNAYVALLNIHHVLNEENAEHKMNIRISSLKLMSPLYLFKFSASPYEKKLTQMSICLRGLSHENLWIFGELNLNEWSHLTSVCLNLHKSFIFTLNDSLAGFSLYPAMVLCAQSRNNNSDTIGS